MMGEQSIDNTNYAASNTSGLTFEFLGDEIAQVLLTRIIMIIRGSML